MNLYFGQGLKGMTYFWSMISRVSVGVIQLAGAGTARGWLDVSFCSYRLRASLYGFFTWSLKTTASSGYLDFLHGGSGFQVRVPKTQKELQGFYLSYPRKSQNVTPPTFCWSPRANPDSVWASTNMGMSAGKYGSLGSHLGCWLHNFLSFGVTLLNRFWCDLT